MPPGPDLPSRTLQSTIDIYDNSDADFAYIPETSITTQLQYTFPLASNIGDISLMVSGYWNSSA